MQAIGKIILAVIFVVECQHGPVVEGYMVGDNPYHRVETLDPKGRYVLEWRVDRTERRVIFNVTAETGGYVGFGLSADGKMSGADIVVGGVMPSGKVYFSDRHAVANQFPEEDPSQDWKLLAARETKTHTFLSFSRAFDTCDPQDFPITEDRIALIWAFGERDDLEYHHRNRGVFNVHLLHPDYTPPITRDLKTGAPLYLGGGPSKDVKVWTISTEIVMPSAGTTYWCTVHRTPSDMRSKHHVIGFEVRFPSDDVRSNVHHLLLYKCNVPRGRHRSPHAMFGSYVGHPGQSCLAPQVPEGPMPTEYCTQLADGWGVGGRAVFHPPHVGAPIQPNEYYMLQVHYDNPNQVSGKKIPLHLDFFYTSQLRQFESGMFMVASVLRLPPSFLIPPSSPNHSILGMCSPECTQAMLPPEGVTIFMMVLHAHNAGSRIKFQHFRKGRELPWVLSDDNYSSQFQQGRVINKEVKVLPGDQLVSSCVYDNTKANGTTIAGYSTSQEMCTVFVWAYNRIPDHSHCASGIDSIPHRQRFLAGVGNVTWDPSQLEDVRREELQRFHRTHPQEAFCPPELFAQVPESPPADMEELVEYPQGSLPYRPPQSCSFTHDDK